VSGLLEPAAVTDRLRRLAEMSDLTTSRRMEAKIDFSSAEVTRRLLTQSRLRDSCLRWLRIGQTNGLNQGGG